MQLHWVVDLHRQTIQRAAGGERKDNCKHQCAPTLPEGNRLRGIDAPTPARTVGLPPRRGTYFLSKRKKVPKKAGGTATTGKRLLLPILTAGLAMSRAMKLDSFHKLLERARARLFPPSKWAGLFPSAAYRRSVPPQVALGILTPCRVNCFLPVDRFARQANEGLHFPAIGVGHTHPLRFGEFGAAWVFLQRKRPA